MMALTPRALTLAQAETYFERHYSQDDYYTQGEKVAGRWFGRGAQALGLSGEVAREDFSALLKGVAPRGGEVLVAAAMHNDKHRAGWDGVFSAPKSVSVQALAGGDRRLIEAHRHAVEEALTEVEKYALSRQRGGRESVVAGNVVAARFDHVAARVSDNAPQGRGPDPQLHTHVVFLNLTRRPDQRWRALDPREIYRSQSYASAIYRSSLARAARRLGYRIEITAANGAWELEGYTREQVMAFSQRRQDIEQRMAAAGMSGAGAPQLAAYQTRKAKRDYDERALLAEWRERAAAYGIDLNGIAMSAAARGPTDLSSQQTDEEAVKFSREHNTEREAVIDRRALETAALQHGMGRTDLGRVRQWMALEQESGKLIRLDSDWRNPQGAFTTAEMAELERRNIELMRAGIGRAQAVASAAEITTWAHYRDLLPDQIRAARITLSANDWITAIEGRAGAAKTTTVGAIREFAELHGHAVRGFGPTSGSVKALAEAGVNARTVASLLANPVKPAARKEIWLVDESSLLGSRQMNGVLEAARSAGAARVVFVGDQRQHHAIEAGNPMSQLIRAEINAARLNVIRRQRDPGLRRAVELAARGDVNGALDLLERQGRIAGIPDASKRYAAIANDYLESHRAGQRALVVSPANAERRELNRQIRELLIERGHVAREGREHAILVSADLTRAQRGHARNYQEGDVLRFTRASKKLGIAAKVYARVETVDRGGNLLTLRADDGREIAFAPPRFQSIEVYREERRTISDGDRIQFRSPDKALKVANGEFATVLRIDEQKMVLKLDGGRVVSAAPATLRHIDLGYASTSHAAQGATVDRVIINIDASRSAELVNRKQFYVSLSRPRYDARVYTNDAGALRRAAPRDSRKSVALDALKDMRARRRLAARKQYLNSLMNFPDPTNPALAHSRKRIRRVRQAMQAPPLKQRPQPQVTPGAGFKW
jgi:conjugative relaxase-like TrwC/TraI family protein